jgi:hypothetical protein
MYNTNTLSNFRFSGDYTIHLDWDAWLRMANMDGRFVYVPDILLAHRIHSGSATTIGLGRQARQREDLHLFRRALAQAGCRNPGVALFEELQIE